MGNNFLPFLKIASVVVTWVKLIIGTSKIGKTEQYFYISNNTLKIVWMIISLASNEIYL